MSVGDWGSGDHIASIYVDGVEKQIHQNNKLSSIYTGNYTHSIPFSVTRTKDEITAGTWWQPITSVNVHSIVNVHFWQTDVPPWGLIGIGHSGGVNYTVFHTDDSGVIEPYEYWFTFLVPAGWTIYVAFAQHSDWGHGSKNTYTMNGRFFISESISYWHY